MLLLLLLLLLQMLLLVLRQPLVVRRRIVLRGRVRRGSEVSAATSTAASASASASGRILLRLVRVTRGTLQCRGYGRVTLVGGRGLTRCGTGRTHFVVPKITHNGLS